MKGLLTPTGLTCVTVTMHEEDDWFPDPRTYLNTHIYENWPSLETLAK